MDAERLKAIASRMRAHVEEGRVSGAVTLVARNGKIAHLKAVGSANIEKQTPVKASTIYGIASMTKPITATAVMILQDEGKLSLDDWSAALS